MNKFKLLAAALAIFCVMAFFCALTPWVFDDYGYGAGGTSPADWFLAQLAEHRTWSGKFIGHFMARALLLGPAWLHPVLSPLIFTGLIFCGAVLTLGRAWRERLRAWHLILLAGLVWFALPAFGTVYFWRTGTADYGYGLFFATLFLLPYRFWLDDKGYRPAFGPWLALGGVLAGWSNENTGMLAVLLTLAATLYRCRAHKKVPLWAAAGIVGALTGWILMMTAPGNALRLAKLGGLEKIPAFSQAAFQKFLVFWASQQVEMLPYVLASLFCVWLLWRKRRLSAAAILPGLLFFFMAQACLGAFLFSPSTPYRAMSATFFYLACSTFAFIVAAKLKGRGAKLCFGAFCGALLFSVLTEAVVFVQAQPAIALRDAAREQGTLQAAHFAYPKTDKYFFPTYDIIEINAFRGAIKYQMIPWDKAVPLDVEDARPVKGLIISNMVYLDGVPPGRVHVAAAASQQSVAGGLQALLRRIAPLDAATATGGVPARYAVAAAASAEGMAVLHIPGVRNTGDIAYIAFEESGKPLVWRRVTPQAPSLATAAHQG
ncbi:MAG: hypothetical protein HDR50_05570 [Desulfovibrio sp.]|uniref:DUF6056 family protein n=1 Tax=Desulfovibrio sp. TaxID=885 RepID=UPI001A64C181|nr:DUF6056 family protein [Desulfovibrio sp.]MBD5417119.1 hypothetical protein [Desulfovibrio sp.]